MSTHINPTLNGSRRKDLLFLTSDFAGMDSHLSSLFATWPEAPTWQGKLLFMAVQLGFLW